MTLRIPTAALTAGQALDRADTPEELEAAWVENGCNLFSGKAREHLNEVRLRVGKRHRQVAEAARVARGS